MRDLISAWFYVCTRPPGVVVIVAASLLITGIMGVLSGQWIWWIVPVYAVCLALGSLLGMMLGYLMSGD